jgi:hypothetical protein
MRIASNSMGKAAQELKRAEVMKLGTIGLTTTASIGTGISGVTKTTNPIAAMKRSITGITVIFPTAASENRNNTGTGGTSIPIRTKREINYGKSACRLRTRSSPRSWMKAATVISTFTPKTSRKTIMPELSAEFRAHCRASADRGARYCTVSGQRSPSDGSVASPSSRSPRCTSSANITSRRPLCKTSISFPCSSGKLASCTREPRSRCTHNGLPSFW